MPHDQFFDHRLREPRWWIRRLPLNKWQFACLAAFTRPAHARQVPGPVRSAATQRNDLIDAEYNVVRHEYSEGVSVMPAQNSRQEGDESPSAAMRNFIYGFWVSRAVYVAAQLGIPDLLRDRARSAGELADATDMHVSSLNRVLRTLVSIGALKEDEQGRFGLTPVGATLRSDVPDSLRALALLHLGEENFQAWGDILHSVKTGESAFNHRFGMNVWEHRTQHPKRAKIFDEAMANIVAIVNQAILSAYDFSSIRKMVDVGGGNGSFLVALLNANPEMRGVVFDVPHAVEGARRRIAAVGLMDRCDVAAGDFFVSVPGGADAYLLSRVIHDWDDAHSVAILQNCRRTMPLQSKLLLVERVIPARAEHSSGIPNPFLSDLNMLVVTGGRERTEVEYGALFEAASFRLTRIVPTASEMSVIEAVPA